MGGPELQWEKQFRWRECEYIKVDFVICHSNSSFVIFFIQFVHSIWRRISFKLVPPGNSLHIYRVSQKKRNGGFSVPCELKVLYIFTSLDKTSSGEENDTKIVKFGWVILSLCTLLEIQSFSNFAGFLGPMSEEFCWDKQSIITLSCGSPLFRISFVATDQRASTKHRMEGLSRHNSSLTGCKNPAKFEN